MKVMYDHFSKIAPKYRELRITDSEPIHFVKNMLDELPEIKAADIGCGTGRYCLKLFEHLGDKLYLYCVDQNEKMLKQLNEHLTQNNIRNFRIEKAEASELPIEDNSLDCVFAFNAIHHFKLIKFLNECCRVLKNNGYLFIYTRLRSQNCRNIWGQFFPSFIEKENRLYELHELESIISQIPKFRIQSVQFFKFRRVSSMDELLEKAKNCHYSTFYLYEEKELEQSLSEFKQNLCNHFEDLANIHWFDEYTLLVIKKQAL